MLLMSFSSHSHWRKNLLSMQFLLFFYFILWTIIINLEKRFFLYLLLLIKQIWFICDRKKPINHAEKKICFVKRKIIGSRERNKKEYFVIWTHLDTKENVDYYHCHEYVCCGLYYLLYVEAKRNKQLLNIDSTWCVLKKQKKK